MSMTLYKTGGLLAVCVMGLFAGNGSAQSLEHLDRLAVQLERQAKDLHREVHAHVNNAPRAAELEREVREIERLAGHIHQLVERKANITHLRTEVRKLDRLVHHVGDVVDTVLRSGRVSRQGASDIRRALKEVDRTAHHMEDHIN